MQKHTDWVEQQASILELNKIDYMLCQSCIALVNTVTTGNKAMPTINYNCNIPVFIKKNVSLSWEPSNVVYCTCGVSQQLRDGEMTREHFIKQLKSIADTKLNTNYNTDPVVPGADDLVETTETTETAIPVPE